MYCTGQDLKKRFGEDEIIDLTDRNNAGVVDDEVLDQAISDASALMDGYIGGRYQLPLANVPAALNPLACDIARYLMYDEQASEQVTKRYDAAIKFLENVSKGTVSLGMSSAGEAPQSNDFATVESAGSVFSRDNGNGFI